MSPKKTADLNSHDFEDIYVNLGIDLDTLGCVMLKVDPIDVSTVIPEDWAHVSPSPKRFWIKGLKGGDHATLLYGLLPVYQGRVHYLNTVDDVLEGWESEVRVESVGFFPSPYADEDYACIIAHLTGNLLEAQQRLSFLPHVNTFTEYRPHVTLCYVKARYRDDTLAELESAMANGKLSYKLTPVGIDYGKMYRDQA